MLNVDPVVDLSLDVSQDGQSIVDSQRGFVAVVGDAFDLEFRYTDLRTLGEGRGMFTVYADIIAENEGAIRPLLTETQVIEFSSSLATSTGGHVGISIGEDSTTIPIFDLATQPEDALIQALEVDLGLGAGTIEVRIPQREPGDPFVYSVRFSGDQFAFLDMPNIDVDTSSIVSTQPVVVSITEVTPFVDHSAADPVINPLAFPYNVDTHSSSLLNDRVYRNSVSGQYAPGTGELFNEVGGAGPLIGGGLVEYSELVAGEDGALSAPITDFEVLSIRVQAMEVADDVNFTLNLPDGVVDFHNGEITPYGFNDELTDDQILIQLVDDPGTAEDERTGAVFGTIVAPPGFVVETGDGVETAESGTSDTFTIALQSAPLDTVAIDLSTTLPQEVQVSPAQLVFTPNNGLQPQTVTLTGLDDDVDDGDAILTVITSAVISNDPVYSGLNPPDVSAVNLDDDTAAVVSLPASGLVTTELGGSDSLDVRLDSEPLDEVTVSVVSTDVGEATVAPASLTFTPENWNDVQTVTLTGQDDLVDDGDSPFTVNLSASSNDGLYDGISIPGVTGLNEDNDIAGVSILADPNLMTDEAGAAIEFTIALDSIPSADVTLDLSADLPDEISIAPSSITFAGQQALDPVTVRVTGENDLVDDGDQTVKIEIAIDSLDVNYAALDPADVVVVNKDDDTAGISINHPPDPQTSEDADEFQFTVVLDTIPTGTVLIPISSSDTGEATVAPASLVFTAANALTPQTVTVTGVDDPEDDGDQPFVVEINQSLGSDPNYRIDADDIAAVNVDNEEVFDYGDAPAPYPTTLATDGARHQESELFLGTAPSLELDAEVSDLADADSNDDGVEFLSSIVGYSLGATKSSARVTSSEPGKLDAWVDFNGDGDWLDPGEQIATSAAVDGPTHLTFDVPAGALAGFTFARFRLSTDGGLAPRGHAEDGEVEDYRVQILDGDGPAHVQVHLQSETGSAVLRQGEVEIRSGSDLLLQSPAASLASAALIGTSGPNLVSIESQLLNVVTWSMDGGSGFDQLQVIGSGFALDLPLLDNLLENVESVDVSSSSENRIVIDPGAIEGNVGPGGTVELRVDATNAVDFAGAWTLDGTGVQDGEVYLQVSGGGVGARLFGSNPWTNPILQRDVNNNGIVTAVDALQILNQLRARSFLVEDSSELVSANSLGEEFPDKFYDTNLDGILTPIDALRVINEIGRNQPGSGELLAPSAESGSPVGATDTVLETTEVWASKAEKIILQADVDRRTHNTSGRSSVVGADQGDGSESLVDQAIRDLLL